MLVSEPPNERKHLWKFGSMEKALECRKWEEIRKKNFVPDNIWIKHVEMFKHFN